MNYEKIMLKAKITNERRSKDERAAGFASPENISRLELIRTAIFAIECGIKVDDWNCIAEAQDMLVSATKDLIVLEVKHQNAN